MAGIRDNRMAAICRLRPGDLCKFLKSGRDFLKNFDLCTGNSSTFFMEGQGSQKKFKDMSYPSWPLNFFPGKIFSKRMRIFDQRLKRKTPYDHYSSTGLQKERPLIRPGRPSGRRPFIAISTGGSRKQEGGSHYLQNTGRQGPPESNARPFIPVHRTAHCPGTRREIDISCRQCRYAANSPGDSL